MASRRKQESEGNEKEYLVMSYRKNRGNPKGEERVDDIMEASGLGRKENQNTYRQKKLKEEQMKVSGWDAGTEMRCWEEIRVEYKLW